MNNFIFTVFAEKKLQKLQKTDQNRIISKLKELKQHPNIFSVLSSLIDFKPATHRLRIGNQKLILTQKNEKTFIILDLGHRKDIYK